MNMFPKHLPLLGAVVVAGASFLPNLQAGDYSWVATSNSSWGTTSSWRINGNSTSIAPSDNDDIVSISSTAIQMGASRNIRNIVFSNTNPDAAIINASASTDYTLTIGGTLSVNSANTLTFRGQVTGSRGMSVNMANLNLAAGTVRFGASADQVLEAVSVTGNAVITGGTASFVLANSGTATFNALQMDGGVINIVGITNSTGGLSVTSLSGSGGVIQTQASGSSASTPGVGNLTVGGSGTASYGGTLANGGSNNTLNLTKVGTGVQILTGSNTFTGTTTISAGTLQLGNGGESGSLAGAIVNNATLTFNRSDEAIHSNAISGSGSVSIAGSGTTTFTGSNTYSGLTTVSAGTLKIGNGGASGTITGDVNLNGGSLTVARTGTFTYDGVISGSEGTVTKTNSGTWVLNGASTFSGVTDITSITGNNITLGNANALQNSTVKVRVANGLRFSTASNTYTLGALVGSTVGNISLQDTASSAVTLRVGKNNSTSAESYQGVLSGSGVLEKIGTGHQILTGSNIYSGGTIIREGALVVNNTTGSGVGVGAVTVQSGAALAGTGFVALGSSHAVTVQAGGQIAAGTTDLGTLTFDFGQTTGGLSMLDDASFIFKLGAANASDLIQFYNYTDGDLALGNNVNLSITGVQAGTYNLFAFYSDAGSTAYTGNVNLSNLSLSGLGAFDYTLNYSDGLVTLQVIPEPRTSALLAAAAGLVLFLMRNMGVGRKQA